VIAAHIFEAWLRGIVAPMNRAFSAGYFGVDQNPGALPQAFKKEAAPLPPTPSDR